MINIDELKVGDMVGYKRYVKVTLMESFRYPIIDIKEITRITPKRTKIQLGNVTLEKTEFSKLCIPTEQDLHHSEIAKMCNEISNIQYEFKHLRVGSRREFNIGDLEDEDIEKIYELAKHLYAKYVTTEN